MMRIEAHFLTLHWLKKVTVVEPILNILEQSSVFTPTHWQRDDNPRTTCPYNHQDFLDSLILTGNSSTRSLLRKGKNSYAADIDVFNNDLNSLIVVFKGKFKEDDLAQIFELSQALAVHLEVEFGCVAFLDNQDHIQPYMQGSTIPTRYLQRYGLGAVGIRTWYGAHIVSLIGKERLLDCSIPIQETGWEGVSFDLVEKPWSADWDLLLTSQQKIMDCLAPSGLFGNYKNAPLCEPAPNWVPIPIHVRQN
jgi:hypothetical protein